MSTPQNPYEPDNGSGNQNPNGQGPDNQPPSAPGFSGDQNSAPQYGSQNNGQQPPQYGSQNNGQQPQYGSPNDPNQQPQYGSPNDPNQQPQYGSQNDPNQQPPQYGQSNDTGAPNYDQNQGGYGQGYDPNAQGYDPNAQGYNQDPYGQNQGGYGQGYDPNAQGYDPNAQGYDANQYGQQPAYAGVDGSSDQFIPANPNASYGSYSAGSGNNKSKNIWGILALIGGIAGLVLSIFFGIGFLFGVAGVIFAFVGLSAIKKGLANNKGMTITGMILSFLAILASIISVIVTLIFGGMFISAVDEAVDEQSSSAAPVQDPSDPAQDPSQGAGSSDGSEEAAPPVEDGGVEIGTDLTAAIAVKPGTVNEYAAGAGSTKGEVAVVTVTVKNSGSSDADLGLARVTADNGSGKEYMDVFGGADNYAGGFAFTEAVPANGENTVQLAFAVPSADVEKVHLKLALTEDLGKGTDFEFSKSA